MKHRRRLLAFLLSVVMVFSFAVTAFAETETTLTFLHFNDLHANVKEDAGSGQLGLAKFKTYADGVDPDLILDAGDTLHGTTFATLSEGATMREMLQDVGVDVATAGNHDFNYGTDRLIALSSDGNYPILIANFKKTADGTFPFEKNMIIEKQGIKIGIFGLATPETKTASNPLNTEGYEFLDPVATAQEQVAYLEGQGADIIIALVHLGLYASRPLAEAVDGIDIIIDGHSHDTLPNGEVVNGVLIATAGNHLKNIGRIDVEFNAAKAINGKTAQLITYETASSEEADSTIAAKIASLEAANQDLENQVLGETLVDLDGERENVRTGETNLGNLIADIMLLETGADVALTNGGGIRASIPQGEITMGHVLTTFPFTNYLVKIEVSGSDIIAALEHGLRAELDEDGNLEQNGGFPQIAGMRVVYDKTQPPGSRVKTVTIGDVPLDPSAIYTLVTNDFMAAGGDGYTMFGSAKILSEHGLLSEALAAYILAEGVINPVVDYRLQELSSVIEPTEPTEPSETTVPTETTEPTTEPTSPTDTDPTVTTDPTTVPTVSIQPTVPSTSTQELPKTGESQPLLPLGFILLLVGGTLVLIPIRRYQLKRKEE